MAGTITSANNPGRRRGRKSDRVFRDALLLTVSEETPDGKRKMRAIADAVVDQAIADYIAAASLIRDTLDGKPKQGTRRDFGGDVSIVFEKVLVAPQNDRLGISTQD